MDYEQKYNEALERARYVLHTVETAGCVMHKDLLEEIFPELRESEDERIREEIVDYFKKECECLLNDFRDKEDEKRLSFYNKALAWLEKQKEPVVDKEGMYYYLGGKFIYCGFPVTEENPYDFAMSQQEKEQKPAEPSDFKTKLAEYLQNNSPKDGKYVISSESILEMAKEELLKRGVVQKPVEWSDEDEDIRQSIIKDIKWERDNTPVTVDKDIRKYDKQINFLESLRPSWKPSKEDLMMLEHIIEQYEIGNKNSKVRGYLPKVEELNFLKKVFEIWKN